MTFSLTNKSPARFYRFLLIDSLFFILLCACSQPATRPVQPKGYPKPYRVMGKWYQPIPDSKGFQQQGIASWYGEKFHGRKTSSGEIYNMYALTAAHKTLPLGTHVRVQNLNNNRQIDVRINDRGPFVRGRIIDLSYSAAKKIGVAGAGTAPVKIVALGGPLRPGANRKRGASYVPVDYYRGNFTIQVGAFLNRKNAERFRKKLDQTYQYAHIKTYNDGEKTIYRVNVGRCYTLQKAVEYENIMIRHGFLDAFAVAEE